MEIKKIAGIALLVIGVALLLVSLTADITGVGGDPAFGRDQITGTIVGAIVGVVGLILTLRK